MTSYSFPYPWLDNSSSKAINPAILIEGEIGEIGTGSEIHEEAPQGLTLTTTEEAKEFAAATGIDILASAVGNTHGLSRSMIRGEAQKRLDIDRIAQIRKVTGLFMTLHGILGPVFLFECPDEMAVSRSLE